MTNYPTNGTAFLQCLSGQSPLQITNTNGVTFTVKAVDISEYSTVFAGTPTTITFVGTKADGSKVSATFSTDGVIDGPGTLVDFQTFQFPGTFTGLVTVTINNSIYALDNFVFAEDGTAPVINQPPTVNAGPDRSATIADTVTLSGAGNDSTFANGQSSLTFTWQKVSGPGNAIFADASSAATTVTFSTAGSYVLRLTANDGALQASDDVQVSVIPVNSGSTALVMTSDPGDYIGAGQTYNLTPLDGTFSASRNYDGGVSLSFYAGGNWWDLDFAAPGGAPLRVGSYSGTRFPFQDISSAGLDISGNGRGSNTLTGSFTVKKMLYGSGSTILSFWATFEQHSEGAVPALRGEIKFNADSTAAPVNQAPGVYAGADQRIVYPASAALSGIAADDDLPSAGAFVVTWSVVSGPGTVTFGDAHAAATGASFSTPGAYVLRLTGSDGVLSKQDDIAVTVIDPSEQTSLDLVYGSNTTGPHYTPTDGTFTATRNYRGGVNVSFNSVNYSHWAYLSFAAPANAPLKPGIYSGAVDFGGDPTKPGISLSADGSYNSMTNATFEVKKVIYGANNIVAFWATFSVPAYGGGNAVRGEVLYNAGSTVASVNQKPGVLAGSAQRIVFPASASLSGLAGDDDLPSAASFVTTWSKASGPGTVTFGDEHAQATTATFSAPGAYVLRLTASDSLLSATSEVAITVIDPTLQTSLDMTSDPGDYIGGGRTYHYTLLDGEFSAIRNYRNGVNVSFRSQDNSHWWYLNFGAPGSIPLKPGVYTGAQRFAFAASDKPGLDIYGDGRGSNTLTGSFEVKKIIFGADSTVLSFWATAELHSEGGTPALHAEIKIDAGSTASPVNLAPSAYAGADQRILYPGSVNLAGIVGDDGVPSADSLTSRWSVVSGPGTVTFGDTSSPATTAAFSAPGVYTVRLTASDGLLSGSDDVQVKVVDTSANTSLVMSSEAGDYIGGGQSYRYTLVSGDFTINDIFNGGLAISYSDPAHNWSLHFAPPAGQALQVGTYSGATRWPFQASSQPGLDVSGDGRGSNTLTGSFKILELVRTNGVVTAFHATFEQHSEGATPALVGDIRFNSSDPGRVNMPPQVSAGADFTASANVGVSVTGTVIDDGLPAGSALSLSWTKASGRGNVTFSQADSAQTQVTFSAAGIYTLRLTANDGEFTRSDDVRVVVGELNAVTSLDMVSAPGDWIGGGGTYHLTDATGAFSARVNYDGGVSISYNSGDWSQWWYLDFGPPDGQPFQVGTYTGATRFAFHAPNEPGLDVSGNGRGSNTLTGRFTVLDYAVDGDTVIAFHATFEQHSEGATPALIGEILFKSADEKALHFPPIVSAGGDLIATTGIANPLSGSVQDNSATPSTITWSKVSGPGDVAFTDATSPTSSVTFSKPGAYVLRLTAANDQYTVSDDVSVDVRVQNAVTSLDISSEPGDPIGQGGTYHFTPQTGQFEVSGSESNVIVYYHSSNYSDWWRVEFTAPFRGTLQPGIFQNAPLRVSANARYPQDPVGSFTIYELQFDGSQIRSFRATFEQRSSPGSPRLSGEILFNTARQPLNILLEPRSVVTAGVLALNPVISDLRADHTPLQFQWSTTASGVTFSDSSSAQTTATFTQPGVYRLQVRVTDGLVSDSAETEVRVFAANSRWAGRVYTTDDTLAYVNLTMGRAGSFSGSMYLGTRRVTFSGKFDAQGHANLTAQKGKSFGPLSFELMQDGSLWVGSNAFGYSPVFIDSQTPATPPEGLVGNYAFAFGGTDTPAYGYCWLNAVARSNGTVSLSGRLTDGSVVSGSAAITDANSFSAFLPAPNGRGWVQVDANWTAYYGWQGSAHWVCPAWKIDSDLGLYASVAARLNSATEPLTGSSRPRPALLELGFPGRSWIKMPLVVQPGGLIDGFGQASASPVMTYRPNPVFGNLVGTPVGFAPTQSLSHLEIRSGGILSGYMVDPLTHRAVRFSGILLPAQESGLGFTTTPGRNGALVLETR